MAARGQLCVAPCTQMSNGDPVIVVTSLSSEPVPISKRTKREVTLTRMPHVSMSHQRLSDVKGAQMPCPKRYARQCDHRNRKSSIRQEKKVKLPLKLSPSALFCEHLRQLQPRELEIPPPCSASDDHRHRLSVKKTSTSKLRPLVVMATRPDVDLHSTCKSASGGL